MGDSMIIIYSIITAFSVIGVFYIIQSFFKVLYRQKNTCCKPILMWQVCNNNTSDLETDVRFALSSLKWFNLRDYHKVCFIKCGLNDCDEDICNSLISDFDFELVDKSNLHNIF